ncbi:hypothetical protein K438DRAFT_1756468 [Mycena galopus ATCC 62051]|nr:hypothetical protein K438DRAFT_1756468 [Mycena galopus ATCC 62051]
MSSEPALSKFLVYAPDKTDEGAFERRLSVRSKHLENAAKGISDGLIRVGGAMLTPESLTGGEKKMVIPNYSRLVTVSNNEHHQNQLDWILHDIRSKDFGGNQC